MRLIVQVYFYMGCNLYVRIVVMKCTGEWARPEIRLRTLLALSIPGSTTGTHELVASHCYLIIGSEILLP